MSRLTEAQLQAIAAREGLENLRADKRRRELWGSLWEFVLAFWPIVEPHTKFKPNWHHELICYHLQRVSEGKERRIILTVPPGAAKSSLTGVFWPAWNWIRNPGYSTIHVSYNDDVILRDAEKSLAALNSPEYQELIPTTFGPGKNEKWQMSSARKALGYFMNTERGFRFSTTVKGANTGHRANAIVVDDSLKAQDADNKNARDDVNQWWTGAMSSRVNDPETSAFIIIGQRLHEDDLPGYLLSRDEHRLAKDPDWLPFTRVVIPTEFNPETATPGDPRTIKGELMHPALFNARANEEAKQDLGPYGYSAQHDQNPVPTSGGMFDMQRIVFWYDTDRAPEPHKEPGAAEPNAQIPLPPPTGSPGCRWESGAQSWDLAFKNKLNSDFVCGQYWRRCKGQLYLIDQVHGRMSFTETLTAVKAFTAKHPKAIAKYVEDKANGPAVIDALKNSIMGIIDVNPEGGKVARANAISPLIKAGNIVLPHPSIRPWVAGLLSEMRGFPKAKHDDQVDALTQALNQLHRKDSSWFRALALGGRS